MYRLLIVDDEPIIVNGLIDYFSQSDQWPLEVYGVSSAEEALQLLLQNRMDIVITDIGMPEMNGLELQKRIVAQWPRCKIIFLTGYNQFEFIQEAMRYKGVDYVLKAEGDDAIVKAVERAIESIGEEMKRDELLRQANKQLRLALPSLQKELLRNLLLADKLVSHRLSEQFQELMIPLDADRRVLLVMARVDDYKPSYSLYDRGLLAYAIQNVVQEYLQGSVVMASVEMEPSRMLWFIQPEQLGTTAWDNCVSFVRGSLESVQQTCKELLETSISFVVRDGPVPWTRIGTVYEEYKRMLSQGLGMGAELLLTNRGVEQDQAPAEYNASQLNSKLELIKLQLERGHKEAFEAIFSVMMNEGKQHADSPGIQQEIYYSLATIFLSYLNQHFQGEPLQQVDLFKLTRMEEHASWGAAAEYFEGLAATIFSHTHVGMEREEHAVVNKIHQYVHEHLDKDVSLVCIGDAIGHNSKYLSRLYKKITGEDLSQYIARIKLARAQALLKETHMKIYEVSAAIGFLSEPYFYRFFRKATGFTPQEYRDLHGKA